jgi:DNA-binding transcriptional LysR family regulator
MDVIGNYLEPGELAAFVAALETGTISGAADALELTQSAATKRLQSLERRLGADLLKRGRFGVRPTDAGRLLYPEAKHALSALARASSVVNRHAATAPTLQLAASHTTGGFLLPGWLAAFRLRESVPQRPHVEIVHSHGVLALIRDGHAEIGFIESLEPVDGLESVTLRSDEIVAVVAPGHPWVRRRRRRPGVGVAELAGEPYLTREHGSGTRSVAAAALERAGVPALQPALEVASTQSLKRAVLEGGFTLISTLAVEQEVTAGTLCSLPVTGVDLTRPLRAVRRRRPAARADARRFWRYLGELV